MEYHKDSFLAGLAVGRQLKGWAGAGGDNVNFQRIFFFTGADFSNSGIATGPGPYPEGGNNMVPYTNTDVKNRLIIANERKDRLLLTPGDVVVVVFRSAVPCQHALWFITPVGAETIEKAVSTITKDKDVIDTGWLENGIGYVVPTNTQYVWLNFRRKDNADLDQDTLLSYNLYKVNV